MFSKHFPNFSFPMARYILNNSKLQREGIGKMKPSSPWFLDILILRQRYYSLILQPQNIRSSFTNDLFVYIYIDMKDIYMQFKNTYWNIYHVDRATQHVRGTFKWAGDALTDLRTWKYIQLVGRGWRWEGIFQRGGQHHESIQFPERYGGAAPAHDRGGGLRWRCLHRSPRIHWDEYEGHIECHLWAHGRPQKRLRHLDVEQSGCISVVELHELLGRADYHWRLSRASMSTGMESYILRSH